MSKQLELIESLIKQAEVMTYKSKESDTVISRAEMIIGKIFGENSIYLKKLSNISFIPPIFMTNTPETLFINSFNSGKNQLLNLLKVMKEDIELKDIGLKQ